MKTRLSTRCIGAFVTAIVFFTTTNSWARLPRPIQIHATVVYVDQETHTIVAKPDDKEQKPFVLDWNKETDFIKNGESAAAADIKKGATVVIHYKRVSFRNPLLKKVIWENGKKQGGQQP